MSRINGNPTGSSFGNSSPKSLSNTCTTANISSATLGPPLVTTTANTYFDSLDSLSNVSSLLPRRINDFPSTLEALGTSSSLMGPKTIFLSFLKNTYTLSLHLWVTSTSYYHGLPKIKWHVSILTTSHSTSST